MLVGTFSCSCWVVNVWSRTRRGRPTSISGPIKLICCILAPPTKVQLKVTSNYHKRHSKNMKCALGMVGIKWKLAEHNNKFEVGDLFISSNTCTLPQYCYNHLIVITGQWHMQDFYMGDALRLHPGFDATPVLKNLLGGGGGATHTFFPSSIFFGQFSRHGVGYILIHHQPLWQASKQKWGCVNTPNNCFHSIGGAWRPKHPPSLWYVYTRECICAYARLLFHK